MRAKLLVLAVIILGLGTIAYSLTIGWPDKGSAAQAAAPKDDRGAERGAHDDEEDHGSHAEVATEHDAATTITGAAAEAAGIVVEEAGGATLRETIALTGRVTLNQNATAHVKGRFAGIVRAVTKGPGDPVEEGEVLARVESNDSLQVYPITSPIAGVVLVRNTNIGDVAGDTPLFTVSDVSTVWAEFHVFPRDVDRISVGQAVVISSFEGSHTGEAPITTLLPVAEASSQTVLARVTLPNPDGVWRAGMTVRGDAIVAEREVPVAVRSDAIQRLDGGTVVFVRTGERYTARPIRTGISDGVWTEVIAGLKAGESYVSEQSFRIKANIGKSEAAHEH